MGGDLEIGEDNTIFDAFVVVRIARDIAAALGYLHSRNPPIIHTDVNGRNIFLVDARVDARVCAVLGDVGNAQTADSKTKRVGNWSVGSDVTAFCVFLQQLMSHISMEQKEEDAYLQLDKAYNEMMNSPEEIQLTHIVLSFDKFLYENYVDRKAIRKMRRSLKKLPKRVEDFVQMDISSMKEIVKLLAP